MKTKRRHKIIIAPSILSADFSNLEKQIKLIEKAGADWIHLDIMDGNFVPNITFGPMLVSVVREKTNLLIDSHLMIINPEKFIPAFVEAGANIITVHVETCPHLHRTIQQIKSFGVQAGVTLNPATPATQITEILPFVDIVLIMTVNPGFGGQKFIETMLKKIEVISRLRDNINPKILIEVDGGVNLQNADKIIKAGADVLVAGNSIFKSTNISKTLRTFKNIKR